MRPHIEYHNIYIYMLTEYRVWISCINMAIWNNIIYRIYTCIYTSNRLYRWTFKQEPIGWIWQLSIHLFPQEHHTQHPSLKEKNTGEGPPTSNTSICFDLLVPMRHTDTPSHFERSGSTKISPGAVTRARFNQKNQPPTGGRFYASPRSIDLPRQNHEMAHRSWSPRTWSVLVRSSCNWSAASC